MFNTKEKRIIKWLPLLLGMLLFFPFVIFPPAKMASVSAAIEGLSLPIDRQAMSEESIAYFTNMERLEKKLPALRPSPALQRAAQNKAEDMAKKEYFAHVSPEGKNLWSWIEKETEKYTFAGENLAVNFSDPKDLVEEWMASPAHQENILNGRFEELGIGIAEGKYEGGKALYIVEMYGQNQKNVFGFFRAE